MVLGCPHGSSVFLVAVSAMDVNEKPSVLGLRSVVRSWTVRRWPRFWREDARCRALQEFMIDGQVLSEVFDLDEVNPPAEGTALRPEAPGQGVAQLMRLLGQADPDFDDGRVDRPDPVAIACDLAVAGQRRPSGPYYLSSTCFRRRRPHLSLP